jgi:hypothetical protein
MEKEFKEIPGFNGKYLINEVGDVYTLKHKKILKTELSNAGYLRVGLCLNNKQKKYSVHRLVAEIYLDKTDGCDIVNHKDQNKLNNHVDNLEWCNYNENNTHFTRAKTSKYHGVSWHKGHKSWSAQSRLNGKVKWLGSYKTELEAYNATIKFETDNQITNRYKDKNDLQ